MSALLISSLVMIAATSQGLIAPRAVAEEETQEQRFERLLAPALRDPAKANWKELRAAFAGTPAHQPYSTAATDELKRIVREIGHDEAKESEAALLKLIERERYMRLDSLFILMRLYDNTKQPEKAAQFKKYVDAIIEVLDYPKGGTALDQAVEVLYIEEEYIFLGNQKSAGQKHIMQDGHHFDILTVAKQGNTPDKSLYFNIDLVWRGNPITRMKQP